MRAMRRHWKCVPASHATTKEDDVFLSPSVSSIAEPQRDLSLEQETQQPNHSRRVS